MICFYYLAHIGLIWTFFHLARGFLVLLGTFLESSSLAYGS